jgi:hypothetical protein
MKKKFKKLSLNTETVRHLTDPSLKEAAGGATNTEATGQCTFCTRPCTECTKICTFCLP